jgi:WG containing repeat
MLRYQFPICQVKGPIEPAVPFSHMGEGSIPNKCYNCKLMFEGGCTRGRYIGISYIELDHGPCGIDGPTDSVAFDKTEQKRRVGIPRKCSTCHFLKEGSISALRCSKDAEKWRFGDRGMDWGYEIGALNRWVTKKVKDTTKEEKLYMIIFNKSYGFIDKNGKVVIEPKYDIADHFLEGRAPVKTQEKWGFIDKSGEIVIEPKFDRAYSFNGGLASVKIEGKYGFIDKTGKVVIEPMYDLAIQFSEGLAAVKIDGKYGFIDKSGKVVIDPKFQQPSFFKEGLASVKIEGKYDFIDKSGKMVIEPKFDSIDSFSQGLARVEIERKWGFIDKTGKMVIEPKFDGATSFRKGLALVKIEDQSFLIDKTGEVIDGPYFFDERTYFRVRLDRYVYIDETGYYVLEPSVLWI